MAAITTAITEGELARLEALAQPATPAEYGAECNRRHVVQLTEQEYDDWERSRAVDARDAVPALVAEARSLLAQVKEHEDHCRRVAAIVAEAGHHVTCEPADGVRTMANELEELRCDALHLTDHELEGLRSLVKDLGAAWVKDHQKDGLRALARHLEARKAGG